MRQNGTPDEWGLAIYILRTLRGWTQEKLAETLGTSASVISAYESGNRRTSERAVQRAAKAVGSPIETVYALLSLLHQLMHSIEESDPSYKWDVRDFLADRLALGLESLAREAVKALLPDDDSEWKASSLRGEESESVEVLWDRLERHGPDIRRFLVEEAKDFQSWPLCELLCDRSRAAVETGENSALELAELALHVAERVPGERTWRQCVQGYAWAHLGHARRNRGDQAGAEEAFGRFRRLWEEGTVSAHLENFDEEVLVILEKVLARRGGRAQ